jgi:hypothetical protein
MLYNISIEKGWLDLFQSGCTVLILDDFYANR